MKKIFCGIFLITISTIACAQPRETLAEMIKRAYSLIGEWKITKMNVLMDGALASSTTSATAEILVRSVLGEGGKFVVKPDGSITGDGWVLYTYKVAAGGSALIYGPISLPVNAVASMHKDEDGKSKFSLTGTADLEKRIVKLNYFQPDKQNLKMIIQPTSKVFASTTWPPMTNVSEKVEIIGSTLLLRASSVLARGIKVEFEAVKPIDMVLIINALEALANNNNTNNNNNNSNTNNTNNTNTNTTTPPTTTTTTTTDPPPPDDRPGTGGQYRAGEVIVPIGGSANVVFNNPMPTGNYAITLTAKEGPNAKATLSFSNRTTNGFKVHAKGATGRGTVTVVWVVTPYTN